MRRRSCGDLRYYNKSRGQSLRVKRAKLNVHLAVHLETMVENVHHLKPYENVFRVEGYAQPLANKILKMQLQWSKRGSALGTMHTPIKIHSKIMRNLCSPSLKELQILFSGLHWKIARQTLSEAKSLSSHLSGINLDQIPEKIPRARLTGHLSVPFHASEYSFMH